MERPTDLNRLDLPTLFDALNPPAALDALFALARAEDLGLVGDVTTTAMIRPGASGEARLVARAPGVIAGLQAVGPLFLVFGAAVETRWEVRDGDRVWAGRALGSLAGPLRDLLVLERTLLNLLSRLSGVATLTAAFVERVTGTKARICDTRKTTPGWRGLEKYAVRCGGGFCHRVGLHDAILVKDNHLAGIPLSRLAATLTERLTAAREKWPLRFVEVEADSLDQLDAVLACPPGLIDMILLDNMDAATLGRAVAARDERRPNVLVEASGGVRLDTVAAIARTGVDRISAGALTHSAAALDLALDVA